MSHWELGNSELRKSLAVAVVACIVATLTMSSPLVAAAKGARQAPPQTGTIAGTAKDAAQQNLSGARVQVRHLNPSPGQSGVVASGTTNAQGAFSFASLNPGQYIVEIFDAAGNLLGTTGVLTVSAGVTVTVSVTAGAIAAVAAAGAGGGLLGLGTTGALAAVAGAGALAIVAVQQVRGDASPSR